MAASLSDYEWLVSDAAAPWLARGAADYSSLPALATALRRELSPERTHLVLEQVELRGRGAAKFARAAAMFFARTALEQATDETIAAYKARRLPKGEPLADLCCGIGGDLMALAARGRGVGVERDPALALLAAANCRVLGHAAEVQTADAAAFAVEEFAAWHIDPDRRPQGRRTTRVELHEPNEAALDALLARNPAAAIKLAPATELSPAWQENAEQEWISRGGECRQLVAWFGPLALAAGGRRATILGHDPQAPRVVQGAADRPIPLAEVGAYLFEPDAAVLASHLTGALAAEHQLAALARDVAYLTGPRPVHDPALAGFEVTDVLPFQVKRLKALLRERRIGRLEIKKRGVTHDPETLRKQLAVPGEEAGVLLLAPLRQGVTAILARRCS